MSTWASVCGSQDTRIHCTQHSLLVHERGGLLRIWRFKCMLSVCSLESEGLIWNIRHLYCHRRFCRFVVSQSNLSNGSKLNGLFMKHPSPALALSCQCYCIHLSGPHSMLTEEEWFDAIENTPEFGVTDDISDASSTSDTDSQSLGLTTSNSGTLSFRSLASRSLFWLSRSPSSVYTLPVKFRVWERQCAWLGLILNILALPRGNKKRVHRQIWCQAHG